MKSRTAGLSRRSFLLAAGAGGAATAAALVATRNATAPGSLSGKGKRATRGYHATEHTSKYYRTTKV